MPVRPGKSRLSGVAPRGDVAVRATNDDAFASKIAAVHRSYYEDPFVQSIYESDVQLLQDNQVLDIQFSRPPLINRGTFARVTAIERLVKKFLEAFPGKQAQIVSLGAGYDTLPFRLIETFSNKSLRYVDLDFEPIVAAKAQMVRSIEKLSTLFDDIESTAIPLKLRAKRVMQMGSERIQKEYLLTSCDLRNSTLKETCSASYIEFDVPTIFLSECVLMYMDPVHSDALIRLAQNAFTASRCFINYEPIKPSDPFGQKMVDNIAARGSPLLGITSYPSLDAQQLRFAREGWQHAVALDMYQAFDQVFSSDEIRRANRIERLDEIEEWKLIMEHYALIIAFSGLKEFDVFPLYGKDESSLKALSP